MDYIAAHSAAVAGEHAMHQSTRIPPTAGEWWIEREFIETDRKSRRSLARPASVSSIGTPIGSATNSKQGK
jgi:hypothetical protein